MPDSIPEFPEGARYFVWRSSVRHMNELIHVVLLQNANGRGSSRVFGAFRESKGHSYSYESVLYDQTLDDIYRDWQEVTREGYIRAQSDTEARGRELRGYAQYFKHPPAPKTNHKIGVPKNKLP